MFCSSCGTANADGAATCRICGEPLSLRPRGGLGDWAIKNAKWLWMPVVGLLAGIGVSLYYLRAGQEFEVTGELLYKNERKVSPVRGAQVRVYEDRGKSLLFDSKAQSSQGRQLPRLSQYWLLQDREFELRLSSPATYDSKHDAELAPLGLAALSKMDWTWWEIERLHNCSWAERKFTESLQGPFLVASTSTDMSGHFWLKLRKGRYYVTAESEVPSFWRIENDPLHSDISQPADGDAFWSIPITVTGTMKVVSADPDCNPNIERSRT